MNKTERRKQHEEDGGRFLEITSDLFVVAGLDGYYRRFSPSWVTTLGWTEEELKAQPFVSFVHPDDVAATLAATAGLAEGKPVIYFQNRYRCKDGSYRWLDWRCAPSPDGVVLYAMARDVTQDHLARLEQEKVQAQLEMASRMVSVGTLAAGVAHEINNPLAYVIANINTARDEIRTLSGGSPSGRMRELEEMLDDALEGSDRVRQIVRSLKTFSRVDDERLVSVEIRPIIELSINMAFNEIRHRARLVKDFGPTPIINADEARLGQVIINLLVNAAQAIPEGAAETHEIRIITSTDEAGSAVIEVRDTGPGMTAEVRERIFDPFFTTKPVGVGTGLGLSICHNIVTGMKGRISVTSEPGHGARFRVTLPPAPNQRLAEPDRLAEFKPSQGGRATILVVDDEPAVGLAFRRVLANHQVTVVTKGSEVLELLASGRRFDVIFSDLMMPEMTGMDLFDEMRRVYPKDAGRMVFVSGGAFTPNASDFLDRVSNERLEKPFQPDELRALVQRFLS